MKPTSFKQQNAVYGESQPEYEAHGWLAHSCWEPNDVRLVRMRDGQNGGVRIDWDEDMVESLKGHPCPPCAWPP